MSRILTDDEKRTLYRDGFIVVKQAVSETLVQSALNRIKSAGKGEYIGPAPQMTDLVNASDVASILHDAMGNFDPPSTCQIGIRKVSEAGDHFSNIGYRERDMPYFAAEPHLDGLCTISVPQQVQHGSNDEIYHRYIASGPKGDLGQSAEVMGHNMVPLFQDPEMTLGMGSFTAFVFVCLSDQTREGCGQTALLPGAHHAAEEFFRWQRAQNNHVGPEGPGWPRLNHEAPNGCGLVYLPERIKSQFIDEASETTPDGVKWPRPTQILMEPGDACITVFHMPHSGTRNQHGHESRKNIIFRIRNKRRQPDKVVNGVSDHPDRGQMGEWLTYEAGNNPWERSKDALCDQWAEWEGMQHIVPPAQR